MSTLLATTTDAALTPPDFAWSAFAPELLLAAAVMILLLLLVVQRGRAVLGVLLGGSVLVVGVLLAAQPESNPVLGGTVMAFGVSVAVIPIALGHVPRLIGPWIGGTAVLAALQLDG